ncbi:LAQU0S03e04874g1_1 [Lachancea quebecensis]|uniref:LAQU0S03e04874g1_1 n=1 Tax=Lachancea quebecensis TaxID=1654605 RepID=A0A0N7ML80_9SACH|nr:LAQU0S03e04874g1_1 [Lachancea quebecensis]
MQPLSSPPRIEPRSHYDQSPDSPPPYDTQLSTPTSRLDASVVDKLTSERRRNYQRVKQPLSSPLKAERRSGSRPSPQKQQQNAQRHRERESRAMKARGGALKMEKDVMDLEKRCELRLLEKEAEFYELDPDDAAALESEQEALEDEELVALLQEREEYEKLLELEQQQIEEALACFTISAPDDHV